MTYTVKDLAAILGWTKEEVVLAIFDGRVNPKDFRQVVYFLEVYRARKGTMDAADYLRKKVVDSK